MTEIQASTPEPRYGWLADKSAPAELATIIMHNVNQAIKSGTIYRLTARPETIDLVDAQTDHLQNEVVAAFTVRDALRSLVDMAEKACDLYTTELYRRWAESNTRKVTVGDSTVHVQTQFKPTAVQGKDPLILALLSDPSTADIVKRDYSYQTLKAWIEGLPKDDHGNPELPPHVAGKLATAREASIRVRRS